METAGMSSQDGKPNFQGPELTPTSLIPPSGVAAGSVRAAATSVLFLLVLQTRSGGICVSLLAPPALGAATLPLLSPVVLFRLRGRDSPFGTPRPAGLGSRLSLSLQE